MRRRKPTVLGIFMNVWVCVTGLQALRMGLISGTDAVLPICILIMLDVIAILVHECLRVLWDIREQTRRTGQK